MSEKLSPEDYQKQVEKKMHPSKTWKNCLMAFLYGGAICTVGEFVRKLFESLHLTEELVGSATSVTMVFFGVLLTGLDLYQKMAKRAGAGTVVPITGFANAVASPAIEARTEGLVLGVGAKIFTIAGPVITYGVVSSIAYGLIYWFCKLI
ncbi:MAG: stage V sporulation protein AC [Ruminococcaceae bacterium]|nr:stage V sporulation protein AC [Oscillospiraceae bacterium]